MGLRRRRSNTVRGFSIVEVLVASGVLGVGLVALVEVHGATVENLARGGRVVEATRIAEQRLELLGAQRPDVLALPSCGIGPGSIGCRGADRALASDKPCTSWVDGPVVPSPSGITPSGATGRGYRVDLVIGPHPDGLRQPGGLLATVSVCWADERGAIHELRADRLLVPGT
ncbi:hypothetical protein L6R52_20590 [Myxococcota bacterium]|nr:hypothetical protein [Myxococcota bacterium]